MTKAKTSINTSHLPSQIQYQQSSTEHDQKGWFNEQEWNIWTRKRSIRVDAEPGCTKGEAMTKMPGPHSKRHSGRRLASNWEVQNNCLCPDFTLQSSWCMEFQAEAWNPQPPYSISTGVGNLSGTRGFGTSRAEGRRCKLATIIFNKNSCVKIHLLWDYSKLAEQVSAGGIWSMQISSHLVQTQEVVCKVSKHIFVKT